MTTLYFNEVMSKYKKQFGEPLPLMFFMGVSQNEIVKKARECMRTKRKFKPEVAGVIY